MSSFLYYFPGRADAPSRNNFNEADVKSGLNLVLRDASIAHNLPSSGPDGAMGCMAMISTGGKDGDLAYNKDAQEWWKINDHYWLGWYKDARPTPKELIRPKTVAGELIQLMEHEWLIPVCGPNLSKLPNAYMKAVDGKWHSEVRREFLYLQEDCLQAIADMKNADVNNYEEVFNRHMEFCTRMLSVNYHVGGFEVTALQILGSETYAHVIMAAIGKTTFQRESEKIQASADQAT